MLANNNMNISEFDVPGAKSAPFSFGNYNSTLGETGDGDVKCAVSPSCNTTDSPICKWGITAGDKTIDMCMPSKPNCPMTRMLVPERNIDPGMWNYISHKNSENNEMKIKIKSKKDMMYCILLMGLLILILLCRN